MNLFHLKNFRWQKGKLLLLASLSAWIVFTLPLGFVQPPAASCIARKNATDYELRSPELPQILKRSVPPNEGPLDAPLFLLNDNEAPGSALVYITPYIILTYLMKYEFYLNKFIYCCRSFSRVARAARPSSVAGQSPLDVRYASNYDDVKHKSWVSPIFSSIVYRTQDIQKAFFLLLLLVIIGEFFSAPAITLADSAVITLLGEDADRYGHQRMFGSLGWGLAMFFVGIALDHSTAFPDHPCGPERQEKNYTICFATFSVLMGAALITATQVHTYVYKTYIFY